MSDRRRGGVVQCRTGEEGVWEFSGCLMLLHLISIHLDGFFLSFQVHVNFDAFLSHLSYHPLQLFYGSSASCLFCDEILLHGLEFGQESVPPRYQLFDQRIECVFDFRNNEIVQMELIDWFVYWLICCHLCRFVILIEIILNNTDSIL